MSDLKENDNAFMDWWQEIENFSTRGERAFDVLGDSAFAWCLAAFQQGQQSALAQNAARLAALEAALRKIIDERDGWMVDDVYCAGCADSVKEARQALGGTQ